MTPGTPLTGRVRARRTEILHVEDSTADAELLRDALAEFPELSVRHVADGAEALAYLRNGNGNAGPRRPDLVLLDLDLPRVDGRRVLAEIKRDPALRAIPVVVLSGSALPEDRTRTYELGANAYVVKPAQLHQFRAVVRAICEFWCGAAALPPQP
ncbi:MAG TPA: response regulator [Longimicrobium sp.]|jgi:CheY-like chemotaxis protein|nr:response regulator [Longimicrobium sp.]